MTAPFQDRVAVITGGARGIGWSLAQALVARGARVTVADIDPASLATAAARAEATGAPITVVRTDVTNATEVAELIKATVAQRGRIDYLFNNAGVNVVGETLHTKLEDWQRLVSVNLMGVTHGVLAAYPIMVKQGFGHIVNTSSAAGFLPAPFQVGYATTKHAIVGLSTSLRAEAAQYGVRVSVVCPGWIDTPMKDTQKLIGVERQRVIAAVPIKYYPPDRCADDILAGVAHNRSLIMITRFPKWAHRAQRWFPWLVEQTTTLLARRGL